MRLNKRNFQLKIYLEGRVVSNIRTHSIRSFLNHLRSIKYDNHNYKYYLRVSYGKGINNFNQRVSFFNCGEYDDYLSLISAFNAFNED